MLPARFCFFSPGFRYSYGGHRHALCLLLFFAFGLQDSGLLFARLQYLPFFNAFLRY